MTRLEDLAPGDLPRLLQRFALELSVLDPGEPIPGTYWGEPEAGLVGHRLYVRPDTPVHSALHEASHFVCMDAERRASLDTDAGGEVAEENAVCYLQVLLADRLPGLDRDRIFADMDAWGYSFRLGSARAWFEGDADDARTWLVTHGLVDANERLTWTVRT